MGIRRTECHTSGGWVQQIATAFTSKQYKPFSHVQNFGAENCTPNLHTAIGKVERSIRKKKNYIRANLYDKIKFSKV